MRKILVLSLLLAGCECPEVFDTSSDQGKCWKECAISAAGADYYFSNLNRCLRTACHYPSHRQCQ